MKSIYLAIFLATAAFAQAPLAPPPIPTLGTSDKVAIPTLEQIKNDAIQKYQDAQQKEAAIISEWETAHPGYILNPQTFAVTEKPKPVKPAVKLTPDK